MTYNYTPTETGTHITVLYAMDKSVKARLMWPVVRRTIENRFSEGWRTLDRILVEKLTTSSRTEEIVEPATT
jgi:hypothetical protein